MAMRFLQTAREAAGEFFASVNEFFSDSLMQLDTNAKVKPMFEKRGFRLSRECKHSSCSGFLYTRGRGEQKELFVVGEIETFYKGSGNFGGYKGSYKQCMHASAYGGCHIPSIDGEGEWIPTIDLPRKLKKYL
jgi:hypothetical protein